MIKCTNLDIKDAACLHIFHILQNPTSRPTRKSTQTAMVNAPKKKISPLPGGKYGNSIEWSTQRRHRANKGKSCVEAEWVRAHGALRNMQSDLIPAPEKWQEMHCSSNEAKDKWIKDYVHRETAGPTKWIEDPEPTVQQEQEDTRKAENAALTNRQHKKAFLEMMVAIGDSLSDLASSDDGEYGEDEDDEEAGQGQLSEDNKPSWVMGTICKTVQQHMERIRQPQMKLNELTQLGWEDTADNFCERNTKYSTSELGVQPFVKPQTDNDAAAPAPTTFGELMECLDIVPSISPMLQGTSQPGSSHIWLGAGKPQSTKSIPHPAPAGEPDSSLSHNVKPFEHVNIYPCI